MKDRFDFTCVVYHPNDENLEYKVCSFQVKNPGTFIEFLANCREYEVFWHPIETDENIEDDYIKRVAGIGGQIEDFNISFGSDDRFQTIEVWLK